MLGVAVLFIPAMGMPGPWELGLILVIVMMLFGVGKLPQVGKALGNSIRAFKEGQKSPPIDVTESAEELPKPAVAEARSAAPVEEAETL